MKLKLNEELNYNNFSSLNFPKQISSVKDFKNLYKFINI